MIETEPQQVQLYVSFLHGLSVPKELPPHPIHILRTQGDICSFAFGLQTKVGMLCRASETHSLYTALISTQKKYRAFNRNSKRYTLSTARN